MNGTAAALTWACWASISAGIASRRDVRRCADELADLLRILHGSEQRHAAAERVADDVWLVEPEVVDEGRDVVGHQPDVDRPIDVRRAAVALEVDHDDLVALRQRGEYRPEHLARHESAVQQDHRSPGPVGLVVEVDAVDLGVLADALRLGRPVGGHLLLLASSLVVGMLMRPGSPAKLIAFGGQLSADGRSRARGLMTRSAMSEGQGKAVLTVR